MEVYSLPMGNAWVDMVFIWVYISFILYILGSFIVSDVSRNFRIFAKIRICSFIPCSYWIGLKLCTYVLWTIWDMFDVLGMGEVDGKLGIWLFTKFRSFRILRLFADVAAALVINT